MLFILNSAAQPPGPSPARFAIVSVVVGEAHERTWRTLCAGTWVAYAERIGADIIVFRTRIDPADARSPAWQKLLILSPAWAARYERILWLDSDVIISEDAPDILKYAGPPEKVSLCVDGGRLSPVEGQIYLERMNEAALSPSSFDAAWPWAQREVYLMNGLPPQEMSFNTGVMVLSPKHHREMLESVYRSPQTTNLHEQPLLSLRLMQDDLAHVISPRFNWGVIETIQLYVRGNPRCRDLQYAGEILHFLICAELRNAYFLHFYGAMDILKLYADKVEAERAAAAA